MEDITKDLKKYMKSKGYTQEDIARQTGVNQTRVNALLNGRKAFGKKTAALWQDLFGINKVWLLTGEGDMLVTQDIHHITQHINGNNNANNLTNDPATIDVILRLTKMLEAERAEVERLKSELAELKK